MYLHTQQLHTHLGTTQQETSIDTTLDNRKIIFSNRVRKNQTEMR